MAPFGHRRQPTRRCTKASPIRRRALPYDTPRAPDRTCDPNRSIPPDLRHLRDPLGLSALRDLIPAAARYYPALMKPLSFRRSHSAARRVVRQVQLPRIPSVCARVLSRKALPEGNRALLAPGDVSGDGRAARNREASRCARQHAGTASRPTRVSPTLPAPPPRGRLSMLSPGSPLLQNATFRPLVGALSILGGPSPGYNNHD